MFRGFLELLSLSSQIALDTLAWVEARPIVKIFIGEKELLLPPRCMTEIDGENRESIHRQTSSFSRYLPISLACFVFLLVYSMSDQHVDVYLI